jgi:hypothetical protein
MKIDKDLKRSIRVSRSLLLIGLSFLIYHLSVSPAGAQVRFGLRGGFELTQMDFKSKALDNSNRAGFYVGPQVKFQLPVVGLGVDVAALYNRRDLKVAGEGFTQQSLYLPAHARYGANIGELLGVFLSIGPQLSFNLGDDLFHWRDNEENNNQYSLQNTMLSFDFGVGMNFGPHFEATLYYNLPVGKTADFTWEELGKKLANEDWNRAKNKTNAWHIGLTYFF